MATAYFCDGRIEDREIIGTFDTLAEAKLACIVHAQRHTAFVTILSQDDDGEAGFDMAAQIGRSHIRLYSADA